MKQSKILLFLLSSLAVGFGSCLKERDMNIDPSKGTPNVVEFANTGDNVAGSNSKYPRFTSDLGSMGEGESVKFNLNVSYSGVEAAPEDITVNLGIDPELLAQFNDENGTNYEVPPTDVYSMPTSIVIKKGERMATSQITVTRSPNFDFNVNYALPLKITSASKGAISGNFGKAVYSFSARNQYDGIYEMDATAPMKDLTSTSLVGWYPLDMQLITYTGNSVALYDGINYVDAYGHPIKSGSSGSYYGSFSPVFFFDETGKITEVTNYYGQESGGNKRSAVLDPTGVNQATFNADGSIKSFEVSYIMTQSVASPMAPRTYFHEKFTYKGSR